MTQPPEVKDPVRNSRLTWQGLSRARTSFLEASSAACAAPLVLIESLPRAAAPPSHPQVIFRVGVQQERLPIPDRAPPWLRELIQQARGHAFLELLATTCACYRLSQWGMRMTASPLLCLDRLPPTYTHCWRRIIIAVLGTGPPAAPLFRGDLRAAHGAAARAGVAAAAIRGRSGSRGGGLDAAGADPLGPRNDAGGQGGGDWGPDTTPLGSGNAARGHGDGPAGPAQAPGCSAAAAAIGPALSRPQQGSQRGGVSGPGCPLLAGKELAVHPTCRRPPGAGLGRPLRAKRLDPPRTCNELICEACWLHRRMPWRLPGRAMAWWARGGRGLIRVSNLPPRARSHSSPSR